MRKPLGLAELPLQPGDEHQPFSPGGRGRPCSLVQVAGAAAVPLSMASPEADSLGLAEFTPTVPIADDQLRVGVPR